MTHDTTTDRDGVAERLARGATRRGIRLLPGERLAARPHALDAKAARDLELSPHFWATRKREITTMLPIWDHELDDHSIAGVRKMLRTLERAFRAERERCKGGHWAGEVSRANNIRYRLEIERRLLTQLQHEAEL